MGVLERRFDRLMADYHELAASPLSLAERSQLGAVISKVLLMLERLY
jgi:hypothetical protein